MDRSTKTFNLEPLSGSVLLQEIERFYNNKDVKQIQVILVNGYSLVGSIRDSEDAMDHDTFEVHCLEDKDYLILRSPRNRNFNNDLKVHLNSIASIRAVSSWKAEQISIDKMDKHAYNLHDYRTWDDYGLDTAFSWSQSVAKEIGIETAGFYGISYFPAISGHPYLYGRIMFDKFEPMYCDWHYLSHVNGGIRSVGLSTPFGGVSVGGEASLWSSFEKTLRRVKTTSLAQISNAQHQNENIAIKGTITFFEKKIYHQMEGGKWELGAFTEDWQDNRKSLKGVEWLPIYLLRMGFMYPYDLWERVMTPFILVGSVHKTSMKTFFEEKKMFFKVRMAGFVPQ